MLAGCCVRWRCLKLGDVHQEVNRHATDAAHPGLHVSEADVEVLADALLGDLALRLGVEQVGSGDLDFFSPNVVLRSFESAPNDSHTEK